MKMFTKDETKIIRSPRIDAIRVHIKACKGEKQQFVVLTVHDLGCNHTMWLNFLNHSSMAEIVRRAAFLHVDLPGQHDGAEPLPPE
ncbi:hypothetical protein KUTeg_005633 [Tegillarca granosa]|uniref:Uncharacterized protein n=1 Tax=Tegillarca granosa TaxID=220873 RepID=A0ABQ9FKB2_TEGGR|nr:hypothetical protein KUTeg_005633 [Tegillarca granosa]